MYTRKILRFWRLKLKPNQKFSTASKNKDFKKPLFDRSIQYSWINLAFSRGKFEFWDPNRDQVRNLMQYSKSRIQESLFLKTFLFKIPKLVEHFSSLIEQDEIFSCKEKLNLATWRFFLSHADPYKMRQFVYSNFEFWSLNKRIPEAVQRYKRDI